MSKIIACKTNELESGNMKKVTIDGKEIVVANVGGNYLHVMIHAHIQVPAYQKGLLMAQQLLVDGMVLNLIVQLASLPNSQQKSTT